MVTCRTIKVTDIVDWAIYSKPYSNKINQRSGKLCKLSWIRKQDYQFSVFGKFAYVNQFVYMAQACKASFKLQREKKNVKVKSRSRREIVVPRNSAARHEWNNPRKSAACWSKPETFLDGPRTPSRRLPPCPRFSVAYPPHSSATRRNWTTDRDWCPRLIFEDHRQDT